MIRTQYFYRNFTIPEHVYFYTGQTTQKPNKRYKNHLKEWSMTEEECGYEIYDSFEFDDITEIEEARKKAKEIESNDIIYLKKQGYPLLNRSSGGEWNGYLIKRMINEHWSEEERNRYFSYCKYKNLIRIMIKLRTTNKLKLFFLSWIRSRTTNVYMRALRHWIEGRTLNKFKRLLRNWAHQRTNRYEILCLSWAYRCTNKYKILLKHWKEYYSKNSYKKLLHWMIIHRNQNKYKVLCYSWINHRTKKYRQILRNWSGRKNEN